MSFRLLAGAVIGAVSLYGLGQARTVVLSRRERIVSGHA